VASRTASARPAPDHPAPRRLPGTRAELLALHRDLRRRRDAVPLLSHERAQLAAEIARVEVEIARIERAMDPPRA